MKLSKLASGLLLTLLLVVFVVGCGSSDDGSTGGSGGTEVSTAGGGEYPSEDFWAGFEEVALDHDRLRGRLAVERLPGDGQSRDRAGDRRRRRGRCEIGLHQRQRLGPDPTQRRERP